MTGDRQPPVEYVPGVAGEALALWRHGRGYPLIAMPPAPWVNIQQTAQVMHEIGSQRHPWHLPGYQTLRYDQRGMGQSAGPTDPSLAGQIADLTAIIESLDRPVVLIGYAHAGPAAIAYAHAHPHRVALLVLWCTYADAAQEYFQRGRVRALAHMMPDDWDLFLNTLCREVLGWGFPQARRFMEIFRASAPGPRQIARAWHQLAETDVSALLPSLRVPTIVLHRADCPAPTLAVGQRLAAAIPQAELGVFPGKAPLAVTDHPELIQSVVLAAADHVTRDAPNPGPLQHLIDRGLAASALTPRELETLARAADGLSNREIAAHLVIAPATVKNHLRAAFGKLGARNRAGAVARARELGLLH